MRAVLLPDATPLRCIAYYVKWAMLVLLLLAVYMPAGVQAEEPKPAPVTARDVWLYLPFDGKLDCLIPSDGLRQIDFSTADKTPPQFVDGINGKALRITDEKKTMFSFVHGLQDFPLERGSVVLWVRPEKDLKEQSSCWIYEGSWGSSDLQLSGGRFLYYHTGNLQHFLAAGFDQNVAWKDQWHLLVGAWDGPRRDLYLDGRLLGTKPDTDPLKTPPWSMSIGFLPGTTGRAPAQFLNGAVDELAILKAPLSADEVARLYANGKKGLLATLGGAVVGNLLRKGLIRGEKTTLSIAPYADGDAVRVSALPEDGGAAVKIADLPCKPADISLDTRQFRPGRYTIRLEVLNGGAPVVSDETLTFAVQARRFEEFPVGLSGMQGLPDATLKLLRGWGISLTACGGMRPEGLARDLDHLYQYGIGEQVGLSLHYHTWMQPYLPASYFAEAGGLTPEGRKEILQWLVYADDGSPFSTSLASPFGPASKLGRLGFLRDVLKASQQHPALHSITYDSEYALRGGVKDGRIYLGDYNQYALAYFKEQSGLKTVPLPPKDPPGTIFPDDHPFLKWKDIMGLPNDTSGAGMTMNNREQTALVHQLRPDVLTTASSGGEYGECDAVMDHSYPTIWQPYLGYENGQARLDFLFDKHRARQRVQPLRPVWGLIGWWSEDMQGQPDWCVQDFRLDTLLSVVKGAKLMMWFSTGPFQARVERKPEELKAFTPLGGGQLSRADLAAETERWAKWLHQYGGMFIRLDARPSRRVAVLVSETDAAGKKSSPNDYSLFYPAMRIAGLPTDVITDERILNGELGQYEALALFNIQYSHTSLWNRIKAFAATPGKVVICDQLTPPALRPNGAIVLPQHVYEELPAKPGQSRMQLLQDTLVHNVQMLRKDILPAFKPDALQLTGSDFIAGHWLYSGDARFLALVNQNLFAAESVDVKLAGIGGTVYDLNTHTPVAQSPPGQELHWQVTEIEKAGWKPYLLLPGRIENVVVEPRFANENFTVVVRIQGADKKALKAPIPLHIHFYDPAGKEVTPYETYTAIDPTKGAAVITVPRAGLMDAAGKWRVAVEELVSGKMGERAVTIP